MYMNLDGSRDAVEDGNDVIVTSYRRRDSCGLRRRLTVVITGDAVTTQAVDMTRGGASA